MRYVILPRNRGERLSSKVGQSNWRDGGQGAKRGRPNWQGLREEAILEGKGKGYRKQFDSVALHNVGNLECKIGLALIFELVRLIWP
jgi:hypothetical protein